MPITFDPEKLFSLIKQMNEKVFIPLQQGKFASETSLESPVLNEIVAVTENIKASLKTVDWNEPESSFERVVGCLIEQRDRLSWNEMLTGISTPLLGTFDELLSQEVGVAHPQMYKTSDLDKDSVSLRSKYLQAYRNYQLSHKETSRAAIPSNLGIKEIGQKFDALTTSVQSKINQAFGGEKSPLVISAPTNFRHVKENSTSILQAFNSAEPTSEVDSANPKNLAASQQQAAGANPTDENTFSEVLNILKNQKSKLTEIAEIEKRIESACVKQLNKIEEREKQFKEDIGKEEVSAKEAIKQTKQITLQSQEAVKKAEVQLASAKDFTARIGEIRREHALNEQQEKEDIKQVNANLNEKRKEKQQAAKQDLEKIAKDFKPAIEALKTEVAALIKSFSQPAKLKELLNKLTSEQLEQVNQFLKNEIESIKIPNLAARLIEDKQASSHVKQVINHFNEARKQLAKARETIFRFTRGETLDIFAPEQPSADSIPFINPDAPLVIEGTAYEGDNRITAFFQALLERLREISQSLEGIKNKVSGTSVEKFRVVQTQIKEISETIAGTVKALVSTLPSTLAQRFIIEASIKIDKISQQLDVFKGRLNTATLRTHEKTKQTFTREATRAATNVTLQIEEDEKFFAYSKKPRSELSVELEESAKKQLEKNEEDIRNAGKNIRKINKIFFGNARKIDKERQGDGNNQTVEATSNHIAKQKKFEKEPPKFVEDFRKCKTSQELIQFFERPRDQAENEAFLQFIQSSECAEKVRKLKEESPDIVINAIAKKDHAPILLKIDLAARTCSQPGSGILSAAEIAVILAQHGPKLLEAVFQGETERQAELNYLWANASCWQLFFPKDSKENFEDFKDYWPSSGKGKVPLLPPRPAAPVANASPQNPSPASLTIWQRVDRLLDRLVEILDEITRDLLSEKEHSQNKQTAQTAASTSETTVIEAKSNNHLAAQTQADTNSSNTNKDAMKRRVDSIVEEAMKANKNVEKNLEAIEVILSRPSNVNNNGTQAEATNDKSEVQTGSEQAMDKYKKLVYQISRLTALPVVQNKYGLLRLPNNGQSIISDIKVVLEDVMQEVNQGKMKPDSACQILRGCLRNSMNELPKQAIVSHNTSSSAFFRPAPAYPYRSSIRDFVEKILDNPSVSSSTDNDLIDHSAYMAYSKKYEKEFEKEGVKENKISNLKLNLEPFALDEHQSDEIPQCFKI